MSPVVKDVVLVGAGHAHVEVLRAFGMRPIEGVRLTLLTREVETPYSGMLPGVVAGLYAADDALIDAGRLVRFAGGRLYQGEASGIDLERKRVLCRARPPVPYDVLSLDIGSRPNTEDVPGAAAHALPVKPIDGFLARFEGVLERVRQGRSRRVLMVGGGLGGVELLLSVQARLRREAADPAALAFALVTASADILPSFPARFRARLRAILAERGVALHAGARVAAVEPGGATLADHTRLGADEILWTTEAAPSGWLTQTGLALDAGFVRVDATLRAAADVFAAGDMIAFADAPIPRSGVYAVRAGPVLADNIRATLTGRTLRPFRPQGRALAIVGTGDGQAVMTRNGVVLDGGWAWRLKDRIDRRWMARYGVDLPPMRQAAAGLASALADRAALREVAAVGMRCGGCGAKVGAGTLARALGPLAPALRPEVLVGLEAPDDAAVVDTGGALLSVHSVDYFRAVVDDPYRFGQIAATHALGDLYAMGARPLTALAIATVPYGIEVKIEADLSDMMQGANEVLRAAECALVGGHTSEGAELSLGFAVNGQVDRAAYLGKGGLRPGDALILTKPIGTGVLLAADMRGQARARWVQAALAQMVRSNAEAARVLTRHGAQGATDVTGFGLLGHLVEMVDASGVDVELDLGAIPLLEGAREMAAAGVVSSLQSANLRASRAIRDLGTVARTPLYQLLFDPQTAGGLLAGVPAAAVAACLGEIRAAGSPRAAIVGAVLARSDAAPPIRLIRSRSCR